MTTKDYVAFATMLKQLPHEKPNLFHAGYRDRVVLRIVAHKIADIFEADNPRFNRNKFLAACEVSNNGNDN